MAFDSLDDESIASEKPIYTPSESLADESWSEKTSTMGDSWLDDRPETSCAPLFDNAFVSYKDDRSCSDSPYITPIFTLLVGSSRVQYTVQEGFLMQSPQWAEKCKSKPWGNKISLPDVDEDIGHSLVHYLYTGKYQTLKPRAISSKPPDEAISSKPSENAKNPTATSEEPGAHSLREYRRSVRLYCVARTYGLAGLTYLSICHIEHPQDEISIWNVLDTAQEAYEKLPDDEFWFDSYLRRKLKASLRVDKYLLKKKEFLGRIGKVKKFDQALMKGIAEFYTERAEPDNHKEGTNKEPASEDEPSLSAR